jgi:nitrogen fixation NifU-like protein
VDLRALYEEVILDHNRNPRNYGRRPAGASQSAEGHNPLCGDHVAVHLQVENGVIADVAFEGDGCAISTASASLMTEAVKALTEQGTVPDDEAAALGKLAVLLGVKDFPMRVKCATLPWHTLQAALKNTEESVTTE